MRAVTSWKKTPNRVEGYFRSMDWEDPVMVQKLVDLVADRLRELGKDHPSRIFQQVRARAIEEGVRSSRGQGPGKTK